MASPAPEPYRLDVPDDVLDDLRARLRRTRWPDEIPDSGWQYGSNLAFMRRLTEGSRVPPRVELVRSIQPADVAHSLGFEAGSLEGNTRRAIDIHEGEKVDAGAFKALVKAAVAQNGPPAKKR